MLPGMRELESQLLADGCAGVLLCAERAPHAFCWAAMARRMDGGRATETVNLASGDDPADSVLRLRRMLVSCILPAGESENSGGSGWIAGAGRGWRMLWAEATAGIIDALPEPLDVHGAALALQPGIPSRAAPAELLRAFGAPALHDEPPPSVETWTELLWRVVHEASERGLDWEHLVALPESGRIAPSFERCSFDAGVLRALPEAPGVYAMLDARDDMVYVGKSDCLRRRLGEYFQTTRTPDAKTIELRDRVRRLEWQVTGSELEAILWEDRWIRERKPSVNIAREVHEDAGRYAAHWAPVALALPSVKPGSVECFILTPGPSPLIQIRVNIRRPPRRRLERILSAIQDLDGRPVPPSKDWTDWGARGAELARRFFGRHRARLHWMELAGATSDDLLAMLCRAASEPLDPAEWRSSPP
ncbi:MAG: nucleotide excision repair endonuclease [Kiritimatiellae bacterium]|nr:nucleotide excision repair endonuclease [Kiritimatiellia bacterium]